MDEGVIAPSVSFYNLSTRERRAIAELLDKCDCDCRDSLAAVRREPENEQARAKYRRAKQRLTRVEALLYGAHRSSTTEGAIALDALLLLACC